MTCKKCGGAAIKTDGVRGDNVVEVAVCQNVPKCGWQQVIS